MVYCIFIVAARCMLSFYSIVFYFRMNTDVLFGKQNGLKTILTFTGITQRSELASAPEEWIPDYFCASVGDLLLCRD